MNILFKISFSAVLMAVALILSRFLSLPLYIFGLNFLKISLATGIVMFASFYLGPVFGMIVGAGEDILGSLIFPQGGAYNPLFTISVVLGGLIPYFAYKLINSSKIDRKYPFILSFVLAAVCIFVTYFMLTNDSIKYFGKTYNFELWQKIVISFLSWFLSIVFVLILLIIRRRFKNKKINNYYNVYSIGTSVLLTYMLFKVPVSSLIFSILYSYDFLIIFGARLLIAFATSFIDILFIMAALNISLRFNVKGALIKNKHIDEELIKSNNDIKTIQKRNVLLTLFCVIFSICVILSICLM